MRILVGVHEIAGLIPLYADGFRKLGHDVVTANNRQDQHRFYHATKYDVELKARVFWPTGEVDNQSLSFRLLAKLNSYLPLARGLKLLLGQNHFLFINAWDSLLPGHRDYSLIKKLGKRAACVFTGHDVRNWAAYSHWYQPGSEYLSKILYQDMPLAFTLNHLRMAELYSDVILSQPNQSILAVRPYMHLFVPMELSKYRFNASGRDIPRVIHAPSHKGLKGTEIILQTLDQLASEGVKFDFRPIENMPHPKVVEELEQADIVIDELHVPLHGVLTVEAMASGCAVATGNDEAYEPVPAHRPICSIDPTNIKDPLRRLLTDKEWRLKLAYEGRKYVERYHDHVQVCQRILENLDSRNITQYDHYPEFYTRSYQLPEGEVLPDSLKRMTSDLVRKWGLPVDVDPQDAVRRGLLSADGLLDNGRIPRWQKREVSA